MKATYQTQWFQDELNSTRSENEQLWKELHLACIQMQGEGPLGQDERVQQAKQARDEAKAEAQFIRQALEDGKDRNAVAFEWVQSHHAIEMEENLSLQNQLKVPWITIEG